MRPPIPRSMVAVIVDIAAADDDDRVGRSIDSENDCVSRKSTQGCTFVAESMRREINGLQSNKASVCGRMKRQRQ
jgi:hypothetical protein